MCTLHGPQGRRNFYVHQSFCGEYSVIEISYILGAGHRRFRIFHAWSKYLLVFPLVPYRTVGWVQRGTVTEIAWPPGARPPTPTSTSTTHRRPNPPASPLGHDVAGPSNMALFVHTALYTQRSCPQSGPASQPVSARVYTPPTTRFRDRSRLTHRSLHMPHRSGTVQGEVAHKLCI